MKKLVAAILALVLAICLPAPAWGEETKSVGDYCQEASQAQTSGDMVQKIEEAFEAMKAEAKADETRVKETTPEQMDFDEDEEEEEDEDGVGYPVCTVTRDGKTMQYLIAVKGEPDESGYPLYITLHGGGSSETGTENDGQWTMMFDYYRTQMDDGIYIACRGMENTWNMHFLPEAYPMYDRIIEDMVLLKNADPNRVYLLGFSAGGDGVYQITPRMADRFAAANMSSGHPNDQTLLNVANVPFQIQVGVRDFLSPSAMRSIKGAAFEQTLNGHRETYGFGYQHRVLVHVPEGHNFNDNATMGDPDSLVLSDPAAFASRAISENWMKAFGEIYLKYYGAGWEDLDNEEDFEYVVSAMSYQGEERDANRDLTEEDQKIYADFCSDLKRKITGTGEGEYGLEAKTEDTYGIHYVDQFDRNYCPSQLVWDLATRASSRSVTSSYWLKADKSVEKGLITASCDAEANAFTLKPSDDLAGDFQVLINPHMVDVSRPVTFNTPKGTFTVNVKADPKVVEASLREVTDPYLAWIQEVSYQQLTTPSEPGQDVEPQPQPEPKPEPAAQDPATDGGQAAKTPAATNTQASGKAKSASTSSASKLPKMGDASAAPIAVCASLGLTALAASLLLRRSQGDR